MKNKSRQFIPLSAKWRGGSHSKQELEGLFEVVGAGAQCAFGLSLGEAHGHDIVDVRLRGSRIGGYTTAITKTEAWCRHRDSHRGGRGTPRRRGLRRIGRGGNSETIARGRLRRGGQVKLSCAGAVVLAGGWRDGSRRGFDLSIEVIHLEGDGGEELNAP